MFDLLDQFTQGLRKDKPWSSIVDFTTHRSFLGYEPYPRQLTLLKLIYLETESMTQYDFDVIEEWRDGFGGRESVGVQPDIWQRVKYLKENGYRRFPHIQTVLGRRASKGWNGGIVGAEMLAYMISLDNWQEYYGIQPHKDGFLSSIATSLPQAIKFQFADIKQAVIDCAYLDPYKYEIKDHVIKLQTPADIRYESLLRAKKIKQESTIATLQANAMTSTSAAGRGGTGFANFYDEFAHMIVGTEGPRSSETVYNAYQPSLAQFGKDGLTYIPSSPLTKIGKFYELYTTGSVMVEEYQRQNGTYQPKLVLASSLAEDPEQTFIEAIADPTMLILQLPSWGLYKDWEQTRDLGFTYDKKSAIIEYNNSLKVLEANNKSSFKVEYRGQFAEVQDAYLDADKVDAMFLPFWGDRVLKEQKHGMMHISYHGHSDPGLSGANFAVSIAHLEDAPPDEFGNIWPHALVDYMKVYRAKDYPDKIVDYTQILAELRLLLSQFPSMEVFSFDQWNSAGFISALKQQYSSTMTIKQVTFTKQENFKRAEKFKSAVNLGWVHTYEDNFLDDSLGGGSLLKEELKFLTEKNGVVEKQDFGPVTTKDLADTVMESTTRLLERALDKWRSALMGNTAPVFGEHGKTRVVDVAAGRAIRAAAGGAKGNLDRIASGSSTNRYAVSTTPTRGRQVGFTR